MPSRRVLDRATARIVEIRATRSRRHDARRCTTMNTRYALSAPLILNSFKRTAQRIYSAEYGARLPGRVVASDRADRWDEVEAGRGAAVDAQVYVAAADSYYRSVYGRGGALDDGVARRDDAPLPRPVRRGPGESAPRATFSISRALPNRPLLLPCLRSTGLNGVARVP